MGGASVVVGGSLKADTKRFLSVGGGSDRDGQPITKPTELSVAEMIDGMAQRYGCPPSVIMEEPVSVLPIVELALMREADDQKKMESKAKR